MSLLLFNIGIYLGGIAIYSLCIGLCCAKGIIDIVNVRRDTELFVLGAVLWPLALMILIGYIIVTGTTPLARKAFISIYRFFLNDEAYEEDLEPEESLTNQYNLLIKILKQNNEATKDITPALFSNNAAERVAATQLLRQLGK